MSANVLPLLFSIVVLAILSSCVETNGLRETAHRRSAQRHVRVRRQLSTSANVVELLVVVDKQAYDKYLARNGNNSEAARSEILRYVAGLVKEVNERFANLDTDGFSVRVNATGLVVFTTSAESNATENAIVNGTTINGNTALFSFTTQANALAASISHDYAVLLTGFNVTKPDGSDVDVRTYFQGMCSTIRQGLVENFCVERTALALTRSIALAMGARIDAVSNDCADNFFVQSFEFALPPRNASGNPFTFSNCSATEILTFLGTAFTSCLRTRDSDSAIDVAALTATELGQTYNADAQCVLRFGQGSRLCRALYGVSDSLTYPDDLCRDTRCLIPGSNGTCQGTLPFDGTSCGNQQWCQDGNCTSDSAAPTTISATCPQGDQPDGQCVQFLCALGGALYRDYTCCATCASSGGNNNVTVSVVEPTTAGATTGTVSVPVSTTAAVPTENRTMSIANTGVTSGSQATLSTVGVTSPVSTPTSNTATLSIVGATSPVSTPIPNTATLSIVGATSPVSTPTSNTATLSIVGATSPVSTPTSNTATLSIVGATSPVSTSTPNTATLSIVGATSPVSTPTPNTATLSIVGATSLVSTPTPNTATLSIVGATSLVSTPTPNTATMSVVGDTAASSGTQTVSIVTSTQNTATLSIAEGGQTSQSAQTLSIVGTTEAAATVSVVSDPTTTPNIVGDPGRR